MKKSIFIALIIFSFFSNIGNAQKYKIDSLYLPATGKEIGFYFYAENPEYVFYDLKLDNSQKEVIAELKLSKIESMIKSLHSAKEKYEEWSRIAIDKNCRLVSKRIPQSFRDQTIYFKDDNKWFYEEGVNVNGNFVVDEKGKCQFVLQCDDIETEEEAIETSGMSWGFGWVSTHTNVKHYCIGSYLAFESSNEIDEFIKKLHKVLIWNENNKSNEDLFK